MRFDFSMFGRPETNPKQYKQLLLELSSFLPNHSKFFTDGSSSSSPSWFPAIFLGFTILGEIFDYVTFFQPMSGFLESV